jgi:hypothetical protein
VGHSTYTSASEDILRSRNASRRVTGQSFAYSAAIDSGTEHAQIHALMSPKRADGTPVVRESRDSAAHPNSVPIAVFMDITGSMGQEPKTFQQQLPNLMRLLTQNGYVTDPHVLFGAVADTSDRAVLQVGQFEASLEVDDDLERTWLAGGGAGSAHDCEAYQLVHYFALHHFRTDAWDRRQRKGYLFTVGDERYGDTVYPRHVREVMGGNLSSEVATRDVVAALQQRWHVFHLHAQQGSYRNIAFVIGGWRELLGEDHVVLLDQSRHVAEVIALVVGLVEGNVDMAAARVHLSQLGADADAVTLIAEALGRVAERGIRLRDEAAAEA